MIKYYSLKGLLKEGIDINPIIDEILRITITAKSTYPEYGTWFINKHVPGIFIGTRDTIIATYKNRLIGVANIKPSENKLCTLYFDPMFRYQRLGTKLVEESLKYLSSSKPLITMPSSYINDFKNIIKRYNWQLTDCIDDCYSKDVTELIFNGKLSLSNKFLSDEERIVLAYKHTKDKNILKLLRKPLFFPIKLHFLQKNIKNKEKVLSN